MKNFLLLVVLIAGIAYVYHFYVTQISPPPPPPPPPTPVPVVATPRLKSPVDRNWVSPLESNSPLNQRPPSQQKAGHMSEAPHH